MNQVSNAPAAAPQNPSNRKRLLWPMLGMAGLVILLVLIIGGTKFAQIMKMIAQSKIPQPPTVVTALKAQFSEWQPEIAAVGSMKAVRGVDVTTEIGGIVRSVAFKSGQYVVAGALLVELNKDSDVAQLHALEASADLAVTVLKRDKAQFAAGAIAQAQLDADEADLKAKQAQKEQQAALVEKKIIRAPFAGRMGITSVNPGQYLNPGDKIASLQTINPIYIDFNVPQDQLHELGLGQAVTVTIQSLAGQIFPGKVTAIDSRVDTATRNVTVEATVNNAKGELLPGMFANASVAVGHVQRYLTLPQTSITYNPYGATVFIATNQKDTQGQEALTVQQSFVKTGATRGDQVAILSGVKEGDLVITSGQLKLKNGSRVKIDGSIAPLNDAAPTPQEQ